MNLLLGDCLQTLKSITDNSVDSVVTDPPYGLSFMGKKWDYDVPSVDVWREVFRVLKPGGHVLSFGGTRTYHRMVLNIEDAGFEIRDQLQWLFGTGYPKHKSQLKPANEPICLAVKKSTKSSKLEIDVSRLPNSKPWKINGQRIVAGLGGDFLKNKKAIPRSSHPLGLYPSNVLIDEETSELLGEKSRIFYIVKASKHERGEGNFHPTVKPIKLMQYLVRLITPPGGTCLDPFMGSGSTGVAAVSLGFDFIGCELSEEYFEIARRRIEHYLSKDLAA